MTEKNVPTARARPTAFLHEVLNIAVNGGAMVANPYRL